MIDFEDGTNSAPHSTIAQNEFIGGIQKLKGRQNYSVWKFQVKNLLMYEDLWYPIGGYPEGDTTDEATKARKDTKTLAKINLMLDVSCICHTMRSQTALQAWQALENIFEEKGRVALFHKLFAVKLEDFSTVEDYIKEVYWISEGIAENGKPVDDEVVAMVLLWGLPNIDTYKTMILAAESSGSTLTSDLVIDWLMRNFEEHNQTGCAFPLISNCDEGEERKGIRKWFYDNCTTITEHGLRQVTMSRPIHNRKGNNKVCWNCNQQGHIKSQCTNRNSQEGNKCKNFVSSVTSTIVETALIRGMCVAGTAVGGAVGGAMGTAVGTVGALGAKVIKFRKKPIG